MGTDFVQYVYAGCVELGRRLAEDSDFARQIEAVIEEQVSRTSMEAIALERNLAILTGREVAQAVVGAMRYLETPEETEELLQGFEPSVVRLLRYLVARYGPVLRAHRRRTHYPLGWHKFGSQVTLLENGLKHLHLKIHRNDDTVLELSDDTESLVRLMNLILGALGHVGDYESLDPETVHEFTLQYQKLIGNIASLEANGSRTEH
ncbi:MAG TPA: hypothetical protein VFV52_11660 [Bacilli bacterium]|nr:hypothetical protein [Bacilli bacterium]